MNGLAVVAAVLLVLGCLGSEEDVEIVEVESDFEPTTTTPPSTAASKPEGGAWWDETTTTTTATTTTSTTATTTPTTTSTDTTTSTTLTTTTSSTTTSTTASTTSTTVPCLNLCSEIRYPSPDNCRAGCCISPWETCQYVAGGMDGSGPRCRCS